VFERKTPEETERKRSPDRRVWVRYLATGTLLAATRVALMAWMNYRQAWTATDYFLGNWLYPESVVSIFWRSLVGFAGTKYYLAWGSVLTVGSFVIATPILLVGWLRRRHWIVQIAICALIVPAATLLLLTVVRIFRLDEW